MYKIGVIPGDGIGPEVVDEALKVLEVTAQRFNFAYTTHSYPYGSERFLETGELLPPGALDEFKTHDALFLGAIGDPRAPIGVVERGIVAACRFGLDLYINLRPISLYTARLCPLKDKTPEDIDMIVVRENSEDVYAGIGGFLRKGTPYEVAMAEMAYTRNGVERAIRYAFDLARKRHKHHKLTLVDKANAIAAHDLWRRTLDEVGQEYPDIEHDAVYVDAACMWMVKNPEWFDVVVAPNLFGDIITDLGAMIQGGLGVAAGGNIHPGGVAMFEPIHGSAPKHAGKNVASPIGAINAMAMLLDHIGEAPAARAIETAVRELISSGTIPGVGTNSGMGTTEAGDLVAATVAQGATANA